LVEYIIQSYDTAYSKKETADYSVITTWGVFVPDQDSGPNIILVGCQEGPLGFPRTQKDSAGGVQELEPGQCFD
jgi:phage terminase large subunit-like protein